LYTVIYLNTPENTSFSTGVFNSLVEIGDSGTYNRLFIILSKIAMFLAPAYGHPYLFMVILEDYRYV